MKQHVAAQEKRIVGRPFVKGKSGNPFGRRILSQRFKELFDGFAADYGGPDKLTVFQKTLLAQACRLFKRAEKQKDINLQVRLTNSAARLLAAVQHGGAAPRTPPPKPPAKKFWTPAPIVA